MKKAIQNITGFLTCSLIGSGSYIAVTYIISKRQAYEHGELVAFNDTWDDLDDGEDKITDKYPKFIGRNIGSIKSKLATEDYKKNVKENLTEIKKLVSSSSIDPNDIDKQEKLDEIAKFIQKWCSAAAMEQIKKSHTQNENQKLDMFAKICLNETD